MIYNNKKGADAELLKQFKEPSWNNPVVRFVDAKTKDVIKRKDGVWTTEGIAERMVSALTKAKQKVPMYLKEFTENAKPVENATFAMHCYWEGEAKLGSLPGVRNTLSGWRGKKEVVELEFDPKQIKFEKLLAEAQKFECASDVFAHNKSQFKVAKKAVGDKAVEIKDKLRVAKLSDQKYYLRNSKLRHLPLTKLQATKVNAAFLTKSDWKIHLTPRQLRMAKLVAKVYDDKKEKELEKLVWPDDDSKLASYQSNFVEQLGKITSK